ncbi:MAG: DUF4367 domain-containing protein, partial [Clostridia bacterium]|nr:DUF4367 domain-containing protein [Clostridia bacterium]
TTGKRVAAIFIMIGVFCGLSLGVYSAREPIVEFFLNIKEKYSEFFFNQEDIEKAPEIIETFYTLGYVPEGYELIETKITECKADFIWENQHGYSINFSQYTLHSNTAMDTEDSNFTIIYVDGMKIAWSEKHKEKAYFWNTTEYAFSLNITEPIPHDECIDLIKSLTHYTD